MPVTMTQVGPISTYVNIIPAPTATSGAPKTTPKPKAISLAPAPHAAEPQPTSMETAAPQPNAESSAAPQASGPVRLNPGQVTLIKKVDPVYPPIMLAAAVKGNVVLDAVKQWRYSPPGFEAVVNVTVIFLIR